jgi:hypothetical protein
MPNYYDCDCQLEHLCIETASKTPQQPVHADRPLFHPLTFSHLGHSSTGRLPW